MMALAPWISKFYFHGSRPCLSTYSADLMSRFVAMSLEIALQDLYDCGTG